MSIDKAINNACASLEMEGMNVSDELKTLLVKSLIMKFQHKSTSKWQWSCKELKYNGLQY